MRRTLLSARSSRVVYRTFGAQQTRRAFATAPTKDDSPPSPILRSSEQAHPIGPFYEAILRTPKLPEEKPEVPPVTSQDAPVETPKPTPEHQQSKPISEAKTAEEKPSEPAAAAQEDKKPARRPRKPRTSSANKDENGASSKAKSVPPSSSSSPPTASTSTPSTTSSTSALSTGQKPPDQKEKEQEPPSNDVQARARVVFGSRLVGPAERAERLARLRTESRLVAGVLVPPEPEEPDNCCMSGCVNCVWDRYRDEMEEWASRSAEADRRLLAAEAGEEVGVTEDSMEGVEHGKEIELGVHDEVVDRGAASEDGGGSVGNWETGPSVAAVAAAGKEGSGKIAKDFWDEELYKNVPVGIREFMKQEKRLKERHLREGTVGG